MPCSCTTGWRPCDAASVCHCFVCGEPLCSGCSRAVLLAAGWIRVCRCAGLCLYAAQVASAKAVPS